MLAMGCMRLSTERDRDDARSIEVLHAALDAGVTFLDTADAYCLDATEAGHNERLIATRAGDLERRSLAHRRCDQGRPDAPERRVGAPTAARDTWRPRARRAAARSASSGSISTSCTRPIRARRSRPASARSRR